MMAKLTRRGLIRQTTLTTAAAGALLVAPAGIFAHSGPAAETSVTGRPQDGTSVDLHEPLGAYVHDLATGEITLLVGTRELTVRDPDLVRRLALAAQ